MAEALAKIKDNAIFPATTGDTDGSLLTNLIEALTAGAQLNVGQKGRVTHTAVNYTAATQIVDDHLAGIDTAFGGKASSTHKDTHKSGGGDAFTSSDLLEAVVKRLQVTGPVTLLVGAVADGKYLKRSGSTLVGDDPPGMSAHALGGSYHSIDTLANLNAKITGGSLDFNTAQRTAVIHNLGSNLRHGADTLANLNALVTGGSLDFDSASRPPSGAAGGALSGTYPNPDLYSDHVSSQTLYTCENTSWEDITGMSITPSAGTYLVWFSSHAGRTNTDDYAYIALFVDTTIDGDSIRSTDLALGSYHSFGTQGVLTVNGSQAIKAKAEVSSPQTDFEIYDRSLIILRVAD